MENKNQSVWASVVDLKSRWEGLSMHERFRCGGASLVGPDQFPLLSKIRDRVQKEGQGWERSGDLSQKILVTRCNARTAN